MEPLFVAVAGVEADRNGDVVRVQMREKHGASTLFRMAPQAVEDLMGATRLDLERMRQEAGRQENVQFVANSAAAGVAHVPGRTESWPVLEFSLDGGGTVYITMAQELFDALRRKMDDLSAKSPSDSRH